MTKYRLHWAQFFPKHGNQKPEIAYNNSKTTWEDLEELQRLCDKLNEAWEGNFYHRPEEVKNTGIRGKPLTRVW